jgi:hypothetical protein
LRQSARRDSFGQLKTPSNYQFDPRGNVLADKILHRIVKSILAMAATVTGDKPAIAILVQEIAHLV